MDASVDRYRPPAHNQGEVYVVVHVANQGVSRRDPAPPSRRGAPTAGPPGPRANPRVRPRRTSGCGPRSTDSASSSGRNAGQWPSPPHHSNRGPGHGGSRKRPQRWPRSARHRRAASPAPPRADRRRQRCSDRLDRRNRRGPQGPRELERRVERDRVRRGTHLDPKDSALREAGEDRGSWELVSVAAQASSHAQEETEQRASEGADGHGRLAASS